MGRTKSCPQKMQMPENFNQYDYIPIKRRKNKRRGQGLLTQCYKIKLPSEENQQYYLGDVLVGTTNNEFPSTWSSCTMSFSSSEESEEVYLHIVLDTISIVVNLVIEDEIIKDIVSTKAFAINVCLVDGSVSFKIYFCDLPLLKFNKKVGSCIQSVLTLLQYLSDAPENHDMDESDASTLIELYRNIRITREENFDLDYDDVQHPRLKPELRPYQKSAVRWMLCREKKLEDSQDDLHPLYTVIKLKSGAEIYFDKYSGYVDITKPRVMNSSRGGILADEMGLGKTVEVLACILLHPKPESTSTQRTPDMERSPEVDLISRKRRISENKITPEESDYVDKPKKLKVPDNLVKGSCKKSQNYLALEAWYKSVLQSTVPSSRPKSAERKLQCICGSSNEEGSVACTVCGKMQHAACLGYKSNCGPYMCPQCWKHQPQIECKATLIVSPVSLRTQWCKEICKHIKGEFKVLQYANSMVSPMYPTELTKYDVVITSYNVLQSELKLTENDKALYLRHQRRYSAPGSPLTMVKWWRLCLDEAQTVETPTSMVSEMAKKLNAHFRWAVTGTPISKDVSDLYGLIDYLQIAPYNDKFTWEQILFNPYKCGNPKPMLKFLSEVLWRSSKDEVMDQINIPKQSIEEHWLTFSAIEHYFYKCEHQSNREAFANKTKFYDPNMPLQSLDRGSLRTILGPLLSLRQVCTSPNSTHSRYLVSKKSMKSMKDLLDALIARNITESEEFLRVVLCSLNGLAGIYLLLQAPEDAIENYRKVLRLHTRFTKEEKLSKLHIDKLQVIHTLYNLAEILDEQPEDFGRSVRETSLRKECAGMEQSYIERFTHESTAVIEEVQGMSKNIDKMQDTYILSDGQWYNDMLKWFYVHGYQEELHTKIENLCYGANVNCPPGYKNLKTLQYLTSTWDDDIFDLRQTAIRRVHGLYTPCLKHNIKMLISHKSVEEARDCHLRSPRKRYVKKCSVCEANDCLKCYELKLFAMNKRTEHFEDMSLQGSWKPTSEELILKAILQIGRAKNAEPNCVKDGEVHINVIDSLKKEFKELRKLWTYLNQQIAAQDEVDMCKIRLRIKEPDEEEKKQDKVLKNLNYHFENKFENIHVLNPHEIDYHRTVLHADEQRAMALLEKNLGVRSYLETLHKQHHEDQPLDPCPICKNTLEQHWSIFPCGHCYCLDCMQRVIEQTKTDCLQCCVCRSYHLTSEISYVKPGEQNSEAEAEKIMGNYSTKVESIVELVLKLRSEDEDVKILLFSSWIPVLAYIKEAFETNHILSELVTSGNFERQIEKFKDFDKNVTVLLLPINLGAKGLNLVEATQVILTEPLLDLGEELQAIGRVHRIGQTRPTVVHKFFIRHTIEESMQKAISSDAKNWEKNKVTIRQLTDLFITEDAPREQPQTDNAALL